MLNKLMSEMVSVSLSVWKL